MTTGLPSRTVARRLAASFAFGVMAVSALAAPIAEEAYNLKRVFKAGEVDRYRTVLNVEGIFPVSITFLTTETVKDLPKAGGATIEIKLDKATISANGQEFPFPGGDGQVFPIQYDKDGKVVAQQAGERRTAGIAQLLSVASPNFAPSRPLKTGEEFTFGEPAADGKPGVDGKPAADARGSLKITGVEKASAEVRVETLRVAMKTDTTLAFPGQEEQRIKMESTALVESATGKAHLVEGTATGVKVPMLGEAIVKYRRVLLPPDARPAEKPAEKPAP